MDLSDNKVLKLAIKAMEETKAENVVVYDMDNRSPITDWVVICSGRSQAHVRGIVDRMEKDLKEAGIRGSSIEGYQEGSWVLMDYDVMLVHVFHPETRAYYDLEELLKDFPSQHITSPAPESAQSYAAGSAG